MANKSNSHLARYAVVSNFIGQFAWFVNKDFIKALNGDANHSFIEEVD